MRENGGKGARQLMFRLRMMQASRVRRKSLSSPEGIPFAAGVLHRNDIDYELARMLADCVVPERAYERIGEEAYAQALRIMRNCGRVICCLKDEEFGEMNDGNRRLLREAEKAGLNVERRT